MDIKLSDKYIERLQHAYTRTVRKMKSEIMNHRELGLTGPQFHMLAMIAKNKTCNVSFLAEMLDVKPSAITVMTDRLVQSGYVQRRHDENDRRAVLLSVTELGEEVCTKARDKTREVLRSYLSELTTEELDVLFNIIEKFAEKEGHPHPLPHSHP
ncbi:DNA-binding transcriptional regulator, MarR family [Fontibacillus panacisegetis]|uniref:DNA-binding transcriptional regulator, MarR family n=1 Tax=Fontibacillus panacisegetis TaxID=670482 RepID=A0A1G7JU04_9BACL|nr:MarR family transcriptional regulator [Fontibacillus panacisegetis]SDF27929.1 DNA-binding transcriptional regulator, MarR family [Fontibacillus panacisegetis]